MRVGGYHSSSLSAKERRNRWKNTKLDQFLFGENQTLKPVKVIQKSSADPKPTPTSVEDFHKWQLFELEEPHSAMSQCIEVPISC